jgi:hypothetical protein
MLLLTNNEFTRMFRIDRTQFNELVAKIDEFTPVIHEFSPVINEQQAINSSGSMISS